MSVLTEEQRAARLEPAPTAQRRLSARRAAFVALWLGIAGLHLFSLLRFPTPFIDEAWYADHAWGLLHTGRPLGPLHQGIFTVIEGAWTYFPLLGPWLPALAIKLLGFNLFAVRLVSLIFGLLLLAAIYGIARQLYGGRAGLFALISTSLSYAFFYSAHLARPDVIVAAAGYGAIALYLTDRGRSFSFKSMLAGLLIGLAFDYHPNAAFFGPTLVALYLSDHGAAALKHKGFWSFIAGCGAALTLYAAVHIVPYPQTFFSMTAFLFGSAKNPPLLTPSLWLPALQDAGLQLIKEADFRGPLTLVGIMFALSRRSPADRRLLIIAGSLFAQLALMTPYKPEYYHISVSPAFNIFLAMIAYELLKKWDRSMRSYYRPIIVVSTLLISAAFNVLPLKVDEMAEYNQVVTHIRSVAPPGSSIVAEPRYWFGLYDYNFVGVDEPAYYRHYFPGMSVEESYRIFRPDFIVTDWFYETFTASSPEQVWPMSRPFYINEAELNAFMQARATLAGEISMPGWQITMRIYRINWETEQTSQRKAQQP